MPDRRPSFAHLLAASLFAAGPALAQVAPPFPELLRQTQASSPRLAIGQAEIAAARGEAAQAGVQSNPTIELEAENFAGGRPYDGLGGVEVTASVQQLFELGGKRASRVAAARANVGAAEARALQGQSTFAYELANAYAAAEAATARVAISTQALELARDDVRVVRLLVDNGREAEVRAVQATSAASAAQADLEGARAEAGAALARLSVLASAASPFLSVAGGLLDAPVIVTPAGGENPSIRVARAERDAAALRIDVERRRTTPDLTVRLGVRRLQLEETNALVAGVSLPLPLFDRNRGAVAAASANARGADARLAQASAEAEADLRAALAQEAATAARVAAARTSEAAAGEAYRLVRVGYDAGRLPLTDVLAARRSLIEARGRVLDVRLARFRAAADLARARGFTMAGDSL